MGCSDRDSTAAAYRSTSASVRSPIDVTPVTDSVPVVTVPVLSKATTRTSARRSRKAPPLISTPLRAAADNAATIETGVEITSAQGHEMTSSTSDRYSQVDASAPAASGGTIATTAARAITDGV